MALKAYKHLTDGEVKIVASGSAEETSLLADTVRGGSYLQMTSTGHSQEVAAAQGTALWVDVTSDLGSGGGGFTPEVIEVTDLFIPSGTDWSGGDFHTIDVVPLDVGEFAIVTLLLEVAEPIDPADILLLAAELNSTAGGTGAQLQPTGIVSSVIAADIGISVRAAAPPAPVVYIQTPLGPTNADITIISARASFILI